MKQAVFFDLDGTLWDALVPLCESWNEAMEEHGYPYRFDLPLMQSLMGLTPEETAPIAYPGTSLEEGMRLFKICLDSEIQYLSVHPGKLYPNEEKVLEELSKKYPLYIISNCDKGYIENYLEACHMQKYFSGKTCIGDTGMPKWQNIKMMKEKYSFDDVIYVGDTYKDYSESMKAGVKFIHAAYGFGEIKEDVKKIDTLDKLVSEIEDLFLK